MASTEKAREKARDKARDNETVYEDVGCHVFSYCLSCPLPECVYDEILPTQLRKANESRVVTLFDLGLSPKKIGEVLNLNKNLVASAIRGESQRRNRGEFNAYSPYADVNWALLVIG